MVAAGDVTGAIPYLQKAAAGSDPTVREEAAQALRQLGKQR
jgi:HEAT repeat protein